VAAARKTGPRMVTEPNETDEPELHRNLKTLTTRETTMTRSVYAAGLAGLLSSLATVANADVPFFNATCPGNIEVHADEGGPVYINGAETQLHRFNSHYYEATHGPMNVSISINPDGSVGLSYTRRGGGNGMCHINAHQRTGRRIHQEPAKPSLTISKADMPRFCAGEAAAKFDVRPNAITPNAAFQVGGRYVVQGWFEGGRGTTFFNCYFDGKGNFVQVQ
jgi:hypothetical protein